MKRLNNITAVVMISILVSTGTQAAATDRVPGKAAQGKAISLAAAEKIYERAVLRTTTWMNSNPFTASEVHVVKGKTRWDEQLTIDSSKNIRTTEDGEVTSLVVGGIIYLPPGSASFDEPETEIAQELGLDTDTTWTKRSFEERWLIAVPPIYGLQRLEVEDAYRTEAIEYYHPRYQSYMPFRGIYDPKASSVWSAKKGDSTSGTLKVSQRATKTQTGLTITVTIANGKIVSYVEREKDSSTTIRYRTYIGEIQAPAGPHGDLDQIRLDTRFQAARTKWLAKSIVRSVTRDAFAIAAFAPRERPNLEDWRAALDSMPGAILHQGALELTIGYGGNSYAYCAPNGDFRTAGDVILDGSCTAAGFPRSDA